MTAREFSSTLNTEEILNALDLKIQELTREKRDRLYSSQDNDTNLLVHIRDYIKGDITYDLLFNAYGITKHIAADILLKHDIIDENIRNRIKFPENSSPTMSHHI